MNFKHFDDAALDQEAITSVKNELNSTLRVLHVLLEIDRRRIFSNLGYESILDYAVRRLGYPYDQARRRVDAMRLLKEVPEIEERISSGALNLTTIGYAQIAFKAEARKSEPLKKEEKLQFLERLENKSTRETQKIVAEEFGKEILIRETVKPVSQTTSILSTPVDDELLEAIKELKGFLAHSNPGITTGELLKLACEALRTKVLKQKLGSLDQSKSSSKKLALGANNSAAPLTSARYANRTDKREVWTKANMKCEKCGSTHALQIDHKLPFAKGGSSKSVNLRLLCRNCNQRAAIEEFGISKMRKYLRDRSLLYGA